MPHRPTKSEPLTEDQRAMVEANIALVFFYLRRWSIPDRIIYADMVQEATFALIEAVQSFDPKRGELSTLALLKMRTRLRRYVRRTEKASDMCFGELKYVRAFHRRVNDSFYFDTVHLRLDIVGLGPRDRAIIEGRQMGYTVEEVAERLGCSRSTVSHTCGRILRSLIA